MGGADSDKLPFQHQHQFHGESHDKKLHCEYADKPASGDHGDAVHSSVHRDGGSFCGDRNNEVLQGAAQRRGVSDAYSSCKTVAADNGKGRIGADNSVRKRDRFGTFGSGHGRHGKLWRDHGILRLHQGYVQGRAEGVTGRCRVNSISDTVTAEKHISDIRFAFDRSACRKVQDTSFTGRLCRYKYRYNCADGADHDAAGCHGSTERMELGFAEYGE